MKVPANLSGEKLILDYLSRVTEAGLRVLPKGDRIAFVGRTRALIARECGPAGLADPVRVMEVLTALGEPEELVRQERARLEVEWARRQDRRDRGTSPATVPEPRASGRAAGGSTPFGDTQPILRLPAPWPGQPSGGGPRLEGPQGPGTAGPLGTGPLPRPPASRWAVLARTAGLMARRHPLESLAVVLLGVGGAVLPLPPIWLLGGVCVVLSRLFDVRDAWLALAGPLVIALALTVLAAPVIGGSGNPIAVYLHALGLDVNVLLRPACLACAVYLAWRIPQGRRVRVPPWKR